MLSNTNASSIAAKQWYSTAEVAAMLGRSSYSVQRWCRLQRIQARKRACGRGNQQEWEIHGDEITRYLNHGLLPVVKMRPPMAITP